MMIKAPRPRPFLVLLVLSAVLGASVAGCWNLSAESEDHDAHDEADHSHGEPAANAGGAQASPECGHAEAEEGHGHAGDESREVVRLSEEERHALNITVSEAGPGEIRRPIRIPAEVRLNEDRLAYVSSPVSGIVRQVFKTVGDPVAADEVMAVVESREIADAKASYLAAKSRLTFSQREFDREKSLWEQEISPEKDFLDARRNMEEDLLQLRAIEQKLQALGFTEATLRALDTGTGRDLTRYEIRALLSGEVIERQIVLGKAIAPESIAFVVADLSTVWIDAKVYEKDIPLFAKGQEVVVAGADGVQTGGVISFLSPMVDRETRTALARVVLPNKEGAWRPGRFLEVTLELPGTTLPVVVPKSAVLRIEDTPVVFAEAKDGFEALSVGTGQETETQVEITHGLAQGQRYAAEGAFELKAKLVTGGLGAHAGHGH